MRREFHVRFYEGGRVRFPSATRLMGKGGIISLVDGKIGTIGSLKGFMQLYTIVEEGPRGGLKKMSVVDVWISHPSRAHIDAVQTRSDKPRPTFEENGLTTFNRYWPPAHPTRGGEIETFKAFFARLVPDEKERQWLWNYFAHKARKPWVPMVAVIMVAEKFGTAAERCSRFSSACLAKTTSCLASSAS